MEQLNIVQLIAVWALPVLFAVTVHEAAHGIAARYFGDPTAMMLGRLTLNPLKHIDPIGTIAVPLFLLVVGGFIFGWAKPVPVTVENLRNPKRDMALVALAGPIANLLMSVLWAGLMKLGLALGGTSTWALPIFYMGAAGISINVMLMVLNLLPLPPLDGSRVVSAFLSGPMAWQYSRIEPYGFIILLGLMALGLLGKLLLPLAGAVQSFIYHIAGL